MPLGIRSSEVKEENKNSDNEETEYNASFNEDFPDNLLIPPQECLLKISNIITTTPGCKRKTNVVPRLIDNKRKHLEKNL